MSTNRICRECGNPVDDDEAPTVHDDVGLCELCFAKTAGTPAEPPAKTNRRTQWIAGAAGAAIALLGIGVAVAMSKNGVEITGSASSGSSRKLDHRFRVRGHHRRQAYGPGRSLSKDIWIESYDKGPGRAA